MSTLTTATIAMTKNGVPTFKMCSQCSSAAHFGCMDHCHEIFCAKCSAKHRTNVNRQMDDLTQQLKRCRIDPASTHDEIDANFIRASKQTIQRTRDTVNNLVAEIQQREETIVKQIENSIEIRNKEKEKRSNSALLTSDQAADYTHLLTDCLKEDQLLDTQMLNNMQNRLDTRRALGQSASEAKNPVMELGQFDVDKLLRLRFAPRVESARTTKTPGSNTSVISITVRLGTRKHFQSPMQGSFSIGKHPTAISLNDRYLETFFCRRTGNSLILLSTTAIDVINRGSGIEMSVRLSKVLGTTKDKLLAGTWCEYSQRLILVGNHRMYIFDMQRQVHASKFRCEPTHGDPNHTLRFLGCTHDGSIFYAYKSGSNMYTLQKHSHPSFPTSENEDPDCENVNHFAHPQQTTNINGPIAAMCVTHNRVAIVSRRLRTKSQFDHYLCLYDHGLGKPHGDDVLLPTDIKWITAITSFGNDAQFLICDPRGQQLLLYRSTDGVLVRRFRIGAINACCLTDGKLVLWLQKQYPSSPTGKLHFITAPHLQQPASVAKSLPLLTQA